MSNSTTWACAVALAVCAWGCSKAKPDPAKERSGARPSTGAVAAHASTGVASARAAKRPPKPTSLATLAPPDLPALHAQTSDAPPPPAKAPKDEAPCGTVWTGEEEVPLACETATHDARLGAPAVALIPYSLLHAPKADLPATVDHRLDGFEGRTLSQGKAGTCTAFSLATQIDHAIGLWTGKPGDVSPMELWARYHDFRNAARANVGFSVGNDADWPYDASRAQAWGKCKLGDASCLTGDERRKLDEMAKKGVAFLEQVEDLPADESLFDVIEAKLAAGRDVGTGGKLPKAFKPIGAKGSKYVPDFAEVGTGAHAFSVVGYTHVGAERYFLLKNSWGERWGDGGYAWIHERSLAKIVHGASVVVVDPVADVGLRRHKRRGALVASCPAGEAPDSVDGACAQRCPDGGPRHGGYCGVTEDCARGLVNVTGDCVLAAPVASGTEPKSGIAFTCAPSGCVYAIPKGVEGCASATCQKSCPAPDYRLGRGKGGVLCLE